MKGPGTALAGARPRVVYYSMLQFQPASLRLLHDLFEVVTLPDPDADRTDILEQADAIFTPLGFQCDAAKIDACKKLRAIASNTTGDPHIDTEYAAARGIAVITLKNERAFLSTITPTAEHTWGLLLAVTRRIPWAAESVRQGRWNRRLFPGRAMLSGLSLGVVGMGRLGSMVARYGVCFGMKVRYFDPYVPAATVEGVERVADLIGLVAESDVVSLHATLTAETRSLISAEALAHFKVSSYLINTARAEIVDFGALLAALREGRLAGAALDVFEDEFAKGFDGSKALYDHPIVAYAREHDNLILTPHIGGSTLDAWGRTEEFTIRTLAKALGVAS